MINYPIRTEYLGHHFIIGLSGTKLSDLDKHILESIRPIGILFLKRNFNQNISYSEWLSDFISLLQQIKAYSGREKMFFSIDHEGGRVHRLAPPITQFPYPINFKEKSYDVAKAMATELKSIGLNLSFSPCVDIHTNSKNPVIADRAFGITQDEVIKFSSSFFMGLMQNGVLGCIKHFPGHGDTLVDSHFDLPVVDKSLEDILNLELTPFKALIDQGAPLVMTSHIMFPKIDPFFPATLSKTILQDVLRKKLGFSGIIVSDDLDMHAISKYHQTQSIGVKALDAGCELLIVARHPDGSSDKPLEIANSLVKEMSINESLLNESQISKSKIEYLLSSGVGNFTPKELSKEIFDEHQNLAKDLVI